MGFVTLLQKAIVAELLGTLLFQFMVGFSRHDALAAGVSYAVLRAFLPLSTLDLHNQQSHVIYMCSSNVRRA